MGGSDWSLKDRFSEGVLKIWHASTVNAACDSKLDDMLPDRIQKIQGYPDSNK